MVEIMKERKKKEKEQKMHFVMKKEKKRENKIKGIEKGWEKICEHFILWIKRAYRHGQTDRQTGIQK